jgi:hypothetical protein
MTSKAHAADLAVARTERATTDHRRVIPATCALHRGPVGYTNLMVSTRNATIVLDPHVAGCCVLTLDQAGAGALRDALTQWLNEPGRWPTKGFHTIDGDENRSEVMS